MLEINGRCRKAKEDIPAPRSRKDKKSGRNQGAKSSKDTTSATGKDNATGMGVDSDESEQPSGPGGAEPGLPSDADDDHERSGQTLADTTHERDKRRVRPTEQARSLKCGPERLDMDKFAIDRIDQGKTQEQGAKDDLQEHRKEQWSCGIRTEEIEVELESEAKQESESDTEAEFVWEDTSLKQGNMCCSGPDF